MVTLLVQNNIQKTRTQNTQWKQRYRWKRYRSMILRNVQHFPPASGRMTPINICLWRHREHGDCNNCWCQRRFEPSQETGVKKMINGYAPFGTKNTENTQFSALFSFMLWHIELKFCIWLCSTILQIKFDCRQFASIFVGVMPLLERKMMKYTVFRTFLVHALTYWAEILHMTLFYCTIDQVWVSSIFVGVMPLLELRILKIHNFLHFSLTCFDILSWNFAYDFV